MANIFLSYKRKNHLAAVLIQDVLQNAGHDVWRDTDDIERGADWLDALEKAVKDCDILVSIVSREWQLDDTWVKTEFVYARELKKQIIPVIIDDIEVPFYMKTINVIFAKDDLNAGVKHLLDSIKKLSGTLPSRQNGGSNEGERNYIDRIIKEYVSRQIIYNPLSGKEYAEKGEAQIDNIIDAIMSLKQVVILGEPGAGKSTTLLHLRHQLAQNFLQNNGGPLPILVELGALQELTLQEYIEQQLNIDQEPTTKLTFEALQAQKRVVVLLDGLNEFPPSRITVLQQIKQFVRDAQESNTIIVVTCREQDYRNEELQLPLPDSHILYVRPLDYLQIHNFLQEYLGQDAGDDLFWQLAGKIAAESWQSFQNSVSANLNVFWLDEELEATQWGQDNIHWRTWVNHRRTDRTLLSLATNPYMLRLLILLYEEGEESRIPANRAILFQEVTRLWLIKEARERRVERTQITPVVNATIDKLARLSFNLQKQGKETTFDNQPVRLYLGDGNDIHYKLAVGANILRAQTLPGTYRNYDRQSNYAYSFTHQLFQEYFAAVFLQKEMSRVTAGELIWKGSWAKNWWSPSSWDETIVVLTGFFEDTTQVLNWLAKDNPILAMRCIDESGIPTSEELLSALKTQWVNDLTNERVYNDPIGRALLGRELGRRQWDNRPHTGCVDGLPDIDWKIIPAGDFKYQENDRVEGLPEFEISRFPITYAQYEAFWNDDGYLRREFWTEAGWDWLQEASTHQPLFGWGDQEWHISNHPIIGVTWYEAVAFCRWLEGWYKGYRVQLPTEYQWEKAARGENGLPFPYGNKVDYTKCNLEATSINRTSPVGIFPSGMSSYGVEDMCGNVWEWCLNNFDNITDTSEEISADQMDTIKRTLRGSSWYLERGGGRASARFRFFQHDYDDYTGFRVVRIKRT